MKVTDMIMKIFNDDELDKRIKYSASNRYREFYPNGYGISIVPDIDNTSLFEVAVLKGSEKVFKICYDTHLTDDVIRGLTLKEAHEIAKQISELSENKIKLN